MKYSAFNEIKHEFETFGHRNIELIELLKTGLDDCDISDHHHWQRQNARAGITVE